MPNYFRGKGISFQYPENWRLDDSETDGDDESVTVYAPGGSFWTVSRYPIGADPMTLARGVVEMMKKEYETLEAEEVRENLLGIEIVGFDMNFYFLDFTNSAWIRVLRARDHTYAVFCQGEDHEFDRLGKVFQAMTASLFTGAGEDDEEDVFADL